MRVLDLLSALALSTLALLPSTLAQTTPNGVLVPFAELPLCGAQCGKLYDVQGFCAPTGPATDAMKTCFCSSPDLVPFTAGGPAGDCCATSPTDLQKVKDWFTGYCKDAKAAVPGTTTSGAPTGTQTSTTGSGTASATSKPAAVKDNRTWIQSHYQWIIMAVVLIFAIVGGWLAACVFRKRYLRKRDANYELSPPHQPWVGTVDNTSPYGRDEYAGGGGFGKEDGMLGTKKKRWIVHERT